MGKKRGKGGNGVKQRTQSFEQYMLNQTLNKFKGYIDSTVKQEVMSIAHQQKQLLENLYIRIRVLEELLMSKFDEVDKEYLAERITEIEDTTEGYTIIPETVEEGDRVRVSIATKSKDQEDFQGESRIMVDNVGSGQNIGKELEGAMLGMKAGETKEFQFGQDENMTAKIVMNKVSRRPKPPEPKKEENQETQDASKDEGQQDRSPEAGQSV